MPIYKRPAKLHQCPASIEYRPPPPTHISIGDLHGNALKLIYTLVEEGVLQLTTGQYYTLHDIYMRDQSTLTEQDINEFKKILSTVKVDTTKAITLIGDELADRGQNDYFTLLILQKLQQSHCNIDIMMSNHSMDFMTASTEPQFSGIKSVPTNISLKRMRILFNKGVIQEDEVRKIVDEVYTPMVKAIGYTISQDGQITLFSHAPIGLETVQALAEKFKIPYKEDPPIELIKTIDAII